MNSNTTITAKIHSITAKALKVGEDEILCYSHFNDDLGADEIGMTEIFLSCEDEFLIEFSEKEEKNIKTVENLIKVIKEKTSETV